MARIGDPRGLYSKARGFMYMYRRMDANLYGGGAVYFWGLPFGQLIANLLKL
jgi:hypothetical protein